MLSRTISGVDEDKEIHLNKNANSMKGATYSQPHFYLSRRNPTHKLFAEMLTADRFTYSFLKVSTGFALAAFRIVVLVVNIPTQKIVNALMTTVKIPTGIW